MRALSPLAPTAPAAPTATTNLDGPFTRPVGRGCVF